VPTKKNTKYRLEYILATGVKVEVGSVSESNIIATEKALREPDQVIKVSGGNRKPGAFIPRKIQLIPVRNILAVQATEEYEKD
jgi:hypothetical protein